MTRRSLLPAFLVNAAVLGALIGGLWVGNYVVDPFDANRAVDLGIDKEPITARLSYYDWLVAYYSHNQAPVVVVGDSRVDQFPEAMLSAAAGSPVVNLGAGGARWREVLAMSRFALDAGDPRRLVVQLNVDQLNGSARMDRATTARFLLEHPLQYYLHPRITQASARIVWSKWTGEGQVDERPPMDEAAFWDWQLDAVARIPYANWTFPDEAIAELEALRDRCADEDVALTVVMLPVHRDLEQRFGELGFDDDNVRVKEAIRALVPVIDFDRESSLTTNRSRFRDPYHLRTDNLEDVASEMLGPQRGLANHSEPPAP
jgi:hypothetical protein